MAVVNLRSIAGTRYQPVRRWPVVWAFLDAIVLARRDVDEPLPLDKETLRDLDAAASDADKLRAGATTRMTADACG